MPVELEELSVDALKDLGRVREIEGHNDMTRDELLGALDGPVDDALAEHLGKTRQEVYEAAGAAGIENRKDKQKAQLLRELAQDG